MVETALSSRLPVSAPPTFADKLLQPAPLANAALAAGAVNDLLLSGVGGSSQTIIAEIADDEALNLVANAIHDEGSVDSADTSWDESLLAVLNENLG